MPIDRGGVCSRADTGVPSTIYIYVACCAYVRFNLITPTAVWFIIFDAGNRNGQKKIIVIVVSLFVSFGFGFQMVRQSTGEMMTELYNMC